MPITIGLALLGGCGSPHVGTYSASLEPLAASPAPIYERIKQEMEAEPETLDLKADGTFETRRGTRTVWEGRWRTEGTRLVLRPTRTQGVAVRENLQQDAFLAIESDGSIVDDRTRGDGYRRVYRRR